LAAEVEKLGAGEIVVNAIERDGQMKGYDLELARQINASARVPVTILGGAGSLAHIEELIANFGVIGAAAGSMFVFKGIYRAVLVNYPSLKERDQLLHIKTQVA
jgi:cyclase